jgi:hypothetical protein
MPLVVRKWSLTVSVQFLVTPATAKKAIAIRSTLLSDLSSTGIPTETNMSIASLMILITDLSFLLFAK